MCCVCVVCILPKFSQRGNGGAFRNIASLSQIASVLSVCRSAPSSSTHGFCRSSGIFAMHFFCSSVHCHPSASPCASALSFRLADQLSPVLCHLVSALRYSILRLFCSSLSFPTPRTCDAFLCLSVSSLSTLGFAFSKHSRAIPFRCFSFTS